MIRDKIRKFVAANFLFSDEFTYDDDASFIDLGILDSMGIMEIIDFIEKEFNIKIDYADILPANFDSINAIVAYLRKNIIVEAAS